MRDLCPHRIDQWRDTQDVYDPRQVVGQNMQGHFDGHAWHCLHQEVCRTHPCLKPHGLMANIDAALEQNIFYLPKQQRIADAHHHREADHLGRIVEITEGIFHPEKLRTAFALLKPICSDNAGYGPDEIHRANSWHISANAMSREI